MDLFNTAAESFINKLGSDGAGLNVDSVISGLNVDDFDVNMGN